MYFQRSVIVHHFRLLWSGASVAPACQVRASVMLSSLTVAYYKFDVRVASSGIMFMSRFLKISKLVTNLEGVTQRHHGNLISLLSFLGGKCAKSIEKWFCSLQLFFIMCTERIKWLPIGETIQSSFSEFAYFLCKITRRYINEFCFVRLHLKLEYNLSIFLKITL
jgi:hypothetical protein